MPIKSLDMSCDRKRLAIVDENFNLSVVELKTKDVILKNEKARSIAFNSEIDDIISYFYDGNVYIKSGEFSPTSEKMNGVIIGFKGTKIFLLQTQNMVNILDTSQSSSIMKYAEKKEFSSAYKVACLGATNEEWLYLGFESLTSFDLKIALSCFKKLSDIKLINLIFKVEEDQKAGIKQDVIIGDIKCFKGDYALAEEAYIKGNVPEKAIEMYSLLKMWDKAMELKKKYGGARDATSDKLLKQQSDWLYENGKFQEAADLYISLGMIRRAIEIYGEKGLLEKLIEILRGLNKDEHSDLIQICGYYFKLHKHFAYATEAYLKLGDLKSLVLMNIELEKWDEAFILAKQNPNLLEYTHLQWAENRIQSDKFKEAQYSYKKAGRIDLSMKLLENLIDNAIYEKRFKDASYLLFLFSKDAQTLIKKYEGIVKQDTQSVKLYKESLDLSDIFNSYDIIYKYIEEPFSKDLLSTDSSYIFNACKYLINKITNYKSNSIHIQGLSHSYIFYACAFLAKEAEAYKTSRFSFERLNSMQIPSMWKEKIDLEILTIRSKPYTDSDSNMPLCFRCLNSNPLINIKGDKCSICSYNFIRSPISGDILPLIEFKPSPDISENKARDLIQQTVSGTGLGRNATGVTSSNSSYVETSGHGGEGVVFNRNNRGQSGEEDSFGHKLVEWCEQQVSNEDFGVFECDEVVLKGMNPLEVFIVDCKGYCESQPIRYYKNRMKDIFVSMCSACFRFFRNEEWENLIVKNNNCCPMCRNAVAK